jgi:hypothetical protein
VARSRDETRVSGGSNRQAWAPPIRRNDEFPTLAESFRKKGKPCRVSLLMTSSRRGINRLDEFSPFDSVEYGKVKLKELSIELCWPSNGGKDLNQASERVNLGGKGLNKRSPVNFVQVDRWFRPPPR